MVLGVEDYLQIYDLNMTHMHMHICRCIYLFICTHTHMHTCTCTCIYAHHELLGVQDVVGGAVHDELHDS